MRPTKNLRVIFSSARAYQILTVVAVAILPAVSATAAPTPPAPTASAVITDTTISSTTFKYSIDVTDRATSANTVGTFWFSWTPGEDFMSVAPTAITSPTGWKDKVTNGGTSDGFAIQWVSGSSATSINAGQSLDGYSFLSTETPDQLSANSTFFPGTPQLTAFAYDAGPFSDAGDPLVVTFAPPSAPTAVPLPNSAWMGIAGLAALFAAEKIKRYLSVSVR